MDTSGKSTLETKPAVPFRRDYLMEAIQIAEGKSPMKLKLEHIKALHTAFMGISAGHARLTNLMKEALAEAQKKRVAAGLPPMPPPPGELGQILK